MSIVVSNIKIPFEENGATAIAFAKKRIGVSSTDIKKIYICKKSLDARKKGDISFVYSVVIDLFKNESEIVKAISDNFVIYKEKCEITYKKGNKKLQEPIIVIGFGPAGIFTAFTLAKNGYRVIVLERGSNIDSRAEIVNDFWGNGIFDSSCNVQFGEGGAGAFSDGKLTTRISDPACDYVLNILNENDAPDDILYTSKPHIGTDKLRTVIKNIRQKIIQCGGEVRFNSKVDDILLENGKICGVVTNGDTIKTQAVVLAIGHSARDTFLMLNNKGIILENKSFSVGVRIEQLQSTIDKGLYGDLAGHDKLPIGEYQLSHRCGDRCVYTFCMCPGGFVVPSASEENGIVTNGMSEHARDGKNANSAIVVSVNEKDYGSKPLAGMYFQRELEQRAFLLGGSNYKAVGADVDSFMSSKTGINIKNVNPSYSIGVNEVDFNDIFSKDVNKMLRLGLQVFNSKLKGFSAGEGILTGVETRTSSPVRILRDNELLQAVGIEGLYPCGEGAGYAGGIMSAAVDGIRIAEQIISLYYDN